MALETALPNPSAGSGRVTIACHSDVAIPACHASDPALSRVSIVSESTIALTLSAVIVSGQAGESTGPIA